MLRDDKLREFCVRRERSELKYSISAPKDRLKNFEIIIYHLSFINHQPSIINHQSCSQLPHFSQLTLRHLISGRTGEASFGMRCFGVGSYRYQYSHTRFMISKKNAKIWIKPIVGVEIRKENRLLYIAIAKDEMGIWENRMLTNHNCEGAELPEISPNFRFFVLYPLENSRKI